LTQDDLVVLLRLNPIRLGLLEYDPVSLQLVGEERVVQLDQELAALDEGAVVDDRADAGGDVVALGAGLDPAVNVAVLGRLQGAALDDGGLEDLALDLVDDQLDVLTGRVEEEVPSRSAA